MKTAVLIRHSKSSWKNLVKDHDRPLKKRGLKEAPMMARVLKDISITPDLILSSTAVRALTTAKLIAKEFGIDEAQVMAKKEIYMETESNLLSELQALGDEINTVFLIGHNPGLTDLAGLLTSEAIHNIPTSGVLGIQFSCEHWGEIGKENAKKIFFEIPKTHREKAKMIAQ